MIKTCIILSIVFSALLACQPKKQETTADVDSVAVVTPEPVGNTLTEEQKTQEWKLLFDG